LEQSAQRLPDKVAFADLHTQLTFREVYDRARGIGSSLVQRGAAREPVIVYMSKSPDTLAAFWGVIYAGCYYVPIDEEMPRRRIELILESTQAKYLLYDASTKDKLEELHFAGEVLAYEEACRTPADETALSHIRETALDVDPIYVVFTSGSTGMPKGVVGYHRGVIDYVENLSEVLQFGEESVFANQTPLYLDACLKEVYGTAKFGGTTWLVPKEYFMQPVKLVEFLNEHRINTICWVVSALTMISAFGTFDIVKPQFLHTIAFGSEVFPIKQFNLWKETLPDAEFYNLYGPTEATGMSCYYHATHLFAENEVIPIGRPFRNTQILLLDENGHEVEDGAQGEICIRGTCLTHGYYNNPGKTNEAFTQNPLNPFFTDRIYHTGDLAWRNAEGELVFASRADYQIKHMGHRIELGEIEADVNQIDGIYTCCCIFIKENKKIVLFYSGTVSKKDLTVALRERLPRYMIPNAVVQMDALPLTANGKMDRLEMEKIYQNQKRRKEK
jgi:amino acid adenylation domain-containing protein